jgi:adenylate kinase
MKPHTIIFIGPQGSGKGTQITKLDAALRAADPMRRVVDIQTGRRFRALAQKQENYTEKHVFETLDSGQLQPLFLSVVLWGDAMLQHVDTDCHLLIDGFPRTVNEAKVLESALSFYDRTEITVINLDTPEEIVRARMKSRARTDDTDASIEERLRWYREETIPVIEFYRARSRTKLVDIDGTDTIDGVHEAILRAVSLSPNA